MTDERPERDNDPLVTASYQGLAQERTPGHLDNAVLDRARAAARPRYARLRSWTRPLAWAATVVLSVAIVLQLTQPPQPDAVPAATEPVAREPAPEKRETADEARATLLQEAVHAPKEAAEKPLPAAARQPAGRSDAPAGLSADDLVPSDADMMRDAENFARLRSGPDVQEVEPEVDNAGIALEKKSVAQHCDKAARATPEQWLECIEDLEKAGREADAKAERLVFEAAYPDY